MSNFFTVLYSNPKFPIYLGAVMVVLVISFFIVFFLGNKDKKNTKEPQKNNDASNNSLQSVSSGAQIEEIKVDNNVVKSNNDVDLLN